MAALSHPPVTNCKALMYAYISSNLFRLTADVTRKKVAFGSLYECMNAQQFHVT